MKKEILLAIFVGLALGLIITYGAYRARKSDLDLAEQASTTTETETEPSPTSLIALHSPEDETIQDQESVTVAGTTTITSFVVIFINDEEHITQSDESGNFSIEAKLEKGSNIITVYSLDEDGNSTKIERTVIYTTQPLIEEENTESNEATDSGEVNEQ